MTYNILIIGLFLYRSLLYGIHVRLILVALSKQIVLSK